MQFVREGDAFRLQSQVAELPLSQQGLRRVWQPQARAKPEVVEALHRDVRTDAVIRWGVVARLPLHSGIERRGSSPFRRPRHVLRCLSTGVLASSHLSAFGGDVGIALYSFPVQSRHVLGPRHSPCPSRQEARRDPDREHRARIAGH